MKNCLKRALALILVLSFSCITLLTASAQTYWADSSPVGANLDITAVPESVNAKAAILMDVNTGEILMGRNIDKKLYPASVTKIMTMLLVMEAIENKKITLQDKVTASPVAAGKGGSQIWLKEGEIMTVHELLKATAVYSANDACTALGEYLAGSDDAFTALLNERAKELHMVNTHFDNCTGLDDETTTHLTTARDVAIMACELLKHEKITEYTTIWMDSLRNGETELVNTNKLIRFYKGATGLKTGTTSKAGCCVAASAKRNNTHLVAVILGSDNSKMRFSGARQMLDWGFANYITVTPKIDQSLITQVKVLNGVKESIKPQLSEIKPVLVKKGKEKNIETKTHMCIDVKAPVEKGQVLGKVILLCDKKEIGRYNLTAPKAIRSLTFTDIIIRLFKSIA